jgi:hypothetical protein
MLLLPSTTSANAIFENALLPSTTSDCAALAGGERCVLPWESARSILRPTQPSVGYAIVLAAARTEFRTLRSAQRAMRAKPVPVVRGGNGTLYLIDRHHTLAALDLSAHAGVEVTLELACDLSSLAPGAALWAELARRGYAYLYARPCDAPDALPTAVEPSTLPTAISFTAAGPSLADDTWRALAGFAKNPCAAYEAPCDAGGRTIPFLDHQWAYLFNDAFANASLWRNASAAAAFRAARAALPPPNVSAAAAFDAAPWEAGARQLVYLAHGPSAAAYRVPAALGAHGGALPGVVRDGGAPRAHAACAEPRCLA